MSKHEKELKVKKFISQLDNNVYELKRLIKFIDIGNDKLVDDVNEGIKVIKKKIHKMKKAKDLDQQSKHVKVKKINKLYTLTNDDYKKYEVW